MSLMPESQFSIEEYLFDSTDEDSSAAFGLLKGGLRTVTGAIGQVKREQYELKTPVATLGIRGTEFTAVLQPANTLRVHVGQGKVVLTNDSGSVEVSAGQNAVVRLGQAPRLSDVAPVFMATAPTGDRLVAVLAVREDPFLLDSVMDVAVLNAEEAQLVAAYTPPPPAPEPEPEPIVPEPEPEPEPEPTPPAPPVVTPPVTTDPPTTSDLTSGSLAVWGDGDMESSYDSDGWEKISHSSDEGLITWGAYEDSSGSEPITIPFMESDKVLVDYQPEGVLSYSIPTSILSNLKVYSTGGDWALKAFDLDLKLNNDGGTYGASIVFEGGYDPGDDFQYLIGSDTHTGTLSSDSTSQSFSFIIDGQDQEIQFHAFGDSSFCSNCNLNAQGFLAGSEAEEAGVGYYFQGNDEMIYGTVPLKREEVNVGG